MRYFKSVKEALFEVERDLVEMGINVWPKSMQNIDVSTDDRYQTKELIGYGFRVNDAKSSEAVVAAAEFHRLEPDVVFEYCRQELQDRTTDPPLNPGNSYRTRFDVWNTFLNSKGKFDYTYSERMSFNLGFLQDTLKNDIASRQAVISIWRPADLWNTGGKARIPCSLNYQFLVRPEGKRLILHCIYSMRSCDIYTHFGFDITLAIGFSEVLSRSLREAKYPIDGVHLTMNIGSLHAYKKDYEPRGIF